MPRHEKKKGVKKSFTANIDEGFLRDVQYFTQTT